MRSRSFALALMSALALALPSASAQEPAAPVHKTLGPADIIMPHITDSKKLDYPCFKSLEEWSCEAELPSWPVAIGGKTYDLGLTKHVVFLMLSGVLCMVLLIAATNVAAATGVNATIDGGAGNDTFNSSGITGGGSVQGGIHGTAAHLQPGHFTLENNSGDVTWETDFRSVYASIIDNWLGADSVSILGGNFRNPGLTII